MATIDRDRYGALRRAAKAVLQLYPKGLSLLWLAPLMLALVIVPEFLQHVVEIRLGMFEGGEAFGALQFDPVRMAFGYAKIAGLLLAFLATARFWWTRDTGERWWDLRRLAWGRFALGALLFFGVGSSPGLLEDRLEPRVHLALGIGVTIALLPTLLLMLSGLFGDRSTPFRDMYRRGWPWLLLMALLLVAAFAPAAWLHQMNHRWALGAEPVVVWLLMIFDSLLVGLLAGLTGTALYLGYAAFAGEVDGRSRRATPDVAE